MRQLQNGKEDEELVFVLCLLYSQNIDDGVISMKNEDELEFLEIPCDGRTSFLLGDKINTEWDDGEMYEAEIVDVGRKLIAFYDVLHISLLILYLYRKSNLAHERKKKQAADIIDSIIDKNDSIEDIFSQTTAKDYDIFPDSPNPAEHNISITAAKHLHLKVHSLSRKNLIAVSI
ncbi:PREDICTED: uncharacterized protein LOC109580516 [Amphimedon queenslandica]|uniref:Uncharacterized protein n=1 Tax=Amphimedon queenslandica TaxID=400682 RepID=A0AAN0IXS8_AMPQE|nr:PREDICTED: uncharacterized protein LOC109580516 [Amphimedon queenslandica]|eukprot:XP_019849352.1 PREDICTED: uncharacterized protein LOC109580516 [Amphimedon queenslandica]